MLLIAMSDVKHIAETFFLMENENENGRENGIYQ